MHYPFDTEIYLVHSASHLLNDWGLEFKHKGDKLVLHEKQIVFQENYTF